ncbi:hypothetical protein GCM10011273_03340 [Asticcacaulis endophyticus]|uniref:Uncharacterized protein n=1 Tax=Asticcacaulis endophyticus TaxID=1395890 RepID=A0A918UN35_9CAUL|nr:hypothetical protein GCM10011273_03340 [Asticcacaulis endophyticus]
MSRLNIPDNIPADALDLVQDMLNNLSKADSDGGIGTFGYFVQQVEGFDFGAVCPEIMHQAIGQAIAHAHALANVVSGAPCDCAECRAGRPSNKTKPDVDGLINRVFGGRHG